MAKNLDVRLLAPILFLLLILGVTSSLMAKIADHQIVSNQKTPIKQFKTNSVLDEALRQLLALPQLKETEARLRLKQNTAKILVGPSPFYNGPT